MNLSLSLKDIKYCSLKWIRKAYFPRYNSRSANRKSAIFQLAEPIKDRSLLETEIKLLQYHSATNTSLKSGGKIVEQ
jgi:hypothetical protein